MSAWVVLTEELAFRDCGRDPWCMRFRLAHGRACRQQVAALAAVAHELEPPPREVPEMVGGAEHHRPDPSARVPSWRTAYHGMQVGRGALEGVGFGEAVLISAVPEVMHECVAESKGGASEDGLRWQVGVG